MPETTIAPHVARMIEEINELGARLGKLQSFIKESEAFKKLPSERRFLMHDQEDVMARYLNILRLRLAQEQKSEAEAEAAERARELLSRMVNRATSRPWKFGVSIPLTRDYTDPVDLNPRAEPSAAPCGCPFCTNARAQRARPAIDEDVQCDCDICRNLTANDEMPLPKDTNPVPNLATAPARKTGRQAALITELAAKVIEQRARIGFLEAAHGKLEHENVDLKNASLQASVTEQNRRADGLVTSNIDLSRQRDELRAENDNLRRINIEASRLASLYASRFNLLSERFRKWGESFGSAGVCKLIEKVIRDTCIEEEPGLAAASARAARNPGQSTGDAFRTVEPFPWTAGDGEQPKAQP